MYGRELRPSPFRPAVRPPLPRCHSTCGGGSAQGVRFARPFVQVAALRQVIIHIAAAEPRDGLKTTLYTAFLGFAGIFYLLDRSPLQAYGWLREAARSVGPSGEGACKGGRSSPGSELGRRNAGRT